MPVASGPGTRKVRSCCGLCSTINPMLLWLQALAANLNADLLHTFCNRDLDDLGLLFGPEAKHKTQPAFNLVHITCRGGYRGADKRQDLFKVQPEGWREARPTVPVRACVSSEGAVAFERPGPREAAASRSCFVSWDSVLPRCGSYPAAGTHIHSVSSHDKECMNRAALTRRSGPRSPSGEKVPSSAR